MNFRIAKLRHTPWDGFALRNKSDPAHFSSRKLSCTQVHQPSSLPCSRLTKVAVKMRLSHRLLALVATLSIFPMLSSQSHDRICKYQYVSVSRLSSIITAQIRLRVTINKQTSFLGAHHTFDIIEVDGNDTESQYHFMAMSILSLGSPI